MSHQQDQHPPEENQTRNSGMEVMADQSDNGVQSAMHLEEGEQPRVNTFPSSSRHSSEYPLTLGEYQNTLTGTGRNYGSMNMDANIPMPAVAPLTRVTNISPQNERTAQLRLTRQESLSVPASFCQRTVEEVWSDINRTQQITNNFTHAGSKQSDPAYGGEMSLKDFLVRVGVVREESPGRAQPPPPLPLPPPQLLQLQPQPQSKLPYGPLPQIACYGGGVTNNACGTGSFEQMSSVCSDGIGMSKPGKKRNRDGPMERGFDRRKNRMIKNREAATRSRAKKQAYTIELEAELKHMKDENANLRRRLTELRTRSTQQKWCYLKMLFHAENTEAAEASSRAKAEDKLGLLRRCLSSPF